jgi:hypothetical protein
MMTRYELSTLERLEKRQTNKAKPAEALAIPLITFLFADPAQFQSHALMTRENKNDFCHRRRKYTIAASSAYLALPRNTCILSQTA